MLSNDDRARAMKPMAQLRIKAKREHATEGASFTLKLPGEDPVLDPPTRSLLARFLDFLWETSDATARQLLDMRVAVPDELFARLMEAGGGKERLRPAKGRETLKQLGQLFNEDGQGGFKIALRMTRGPTNACIEFHCDGINATRTVQIALNETTEYERGQLCFFNLKQDASQDELVLLQRPAGSICCHPRSVLHAVTCLTSGTRKNLFVMDRYNGLGEGFIVHVNEDHLQSFLTRIPAAHEGA
mmetsp:Transcript_45894/g.143979  ORF Transcript_45894/g.143979 Transcript_45894/m.143979 type:complete len:244 (-) Transcript_45894:57-788(-)